MSLAEAIRIACDGGEVPGPVLQAAFGTIMAGEASPVQIAALLVAMRTKGERVAEIVAVARTLRSHAETAPLPHPDCIDTCGTGGDGADTFNISTVAALVAAGAGAVVAKHGSTAASSRSGSFDVLEALGVNADLPVADAARVVREVGIGFFFARRAHPAMRHVAPVRQELGVRTMMNCLGPLLNPVGARRQLLGVYARELVEPLAHALGELGAERALVVHGADGLDELTTTTHSHVAWLEDGQVRTEQVDPGALGLTPAVPADLAGGDPAENAAIARAILAGEPGPRREIVLLNAGAALCVAGLAESLAEGLATATRSLDTGAAAEKLEALVRATSSVH